MAEFEASTPLVRETESGLKELTDAGKEALGDIVTDVEGQVFAFKPGVDSTVAAASFARLSRSSNGARVVIADEFINFGQDGKSDDLLRRVVTQFGDDSVMQLHHMAVGIDDVSNLATKKIENGRLAAYLEQSSRYLRFDLKDENGNYRYVVPEEFDAETTAAYKEKMDTIFDIYSELYQKALAHLLATKQKPEGMGERAWHNACHAQACDSVRGLLPAATKASLGVVGSTQAFYNMILSLESEPLAEIRTIGSKVLEAVNMVAPVFFERASNPNRGGLITENRRETRKNSRELAKTLAEQYEDQLEQQTGAYVKLHTTDGTENQLVAKVLTDNSNLPYGTWLEAVDGFTDDEKLEVLDTYVGTRENRRVKPGRALETVQYTFEIQCDFGAFRDIHRHRMVDGFEWQALNPELGHAVPALVEEIGATEAYEQAFATSQAAYKELAENGYQDQAQYATLFGHNMRFSFTINARSLFHSAELRTTLQGHPSYRKVYQEMIAQVEEQHPFITRYMKFLNTDDNAELARLDAERAQEAKLAALNS